MDTPNAGGCLHPFDLCEFEARVLAGSTREFVRIDHAGMVIRLDVTNGTLLDGPVSLRFEIPEGRGLNRQIDALNRFRALRCRDCLRSPSRTRLANRLLALQAFDLRREGRSLRSISQAVFGECDWPGDGEHRKSRVRRLVASGEALVRTGPVSILT
ncbi:DNA -binding domain-containing protein [Pelagerythrobacter aerophilus]|uniref:DNA -binding domain-containing protein n=1 Tax=Pelagerythrobacter aerophilus TaxID=2306995 RepID=UPI0015FFC3D5|nr:DUF2285 domain-containing protein [Pelagerythrobacter aerophilus]